MPKRPYLTAPVPSDRMPSGIPYIVGNEAAERFSYYGMRGILVVYMTKYLLDQSGDLAVMGEAEAKANYHFFVSAAYAFPILGAILSDWLLGKYRTILCLSIVYCLGHLALALDDTRVGLALGLGLIALGSGGIKPCVSANVGDQFCASNQHLLSKVFGWFYFAINFGSFFSTLLTPFLLDRLGPQVAFGVPGVLMLLATWVFWLGRRKFVHVPAGGWEFVKETFSVRGLLALVNLLVIFGFVAVFWSLYDQTGSAWILQADRMDRHFSLFGYEFDVLPSQIHAANPLLIMLFIPAFSYVIYPAIDRVFPLTPLRKIGLGMFVTSFSFMLSAWIENRLAAGIRLHVGWQLLAYVIITAAEIMVSITCLEFAYTQAPRRMKSIVMASYNLSVSLGNAFTALFNYFIQDADGTPKITGEAYYALFAKFMLGTALVFVVVARMYRERRYVQVETPTEAQSA